jgi:1-aminocyclopropane-1-carboxylate deaminase/D-cysteine desulfhydrase-like pyridoxal-dependent ACC family enzyme
LHRWQIPGLPEGTELWIKRDDLSGCQLSGNKVRTTACTITFPAPQLPEFQ